MDRAVRLLVFAFGMSLGSLLVILASESTKEPDDGVVHAGRAPELGYTEVGKAGSTALEDQDESLDDDELVARARERARRRAEALTAAAAAEPVDPGWGRATEQRIAERFAAKAPAGFKLLSTTCKTSLCIAEVETPSRKASTAQSGWHRFLGVSQGYVYHRGDEGGVFRTVVFIARDDHAWPE